MFSAPSMLPSFKNIHFPVLGFVLQQSRCGKDHPTAFETLNLSYRQAVCMANECPFQSKGDERRLIKCHTGRAEHGQQGVIVGENDTLTVTSPRWWYQVSFSSLPCYLTRTTRLSSMVYLPNDGSSQTRHSITYALSKFF